MGEEVRHEILAIDEALLAEHLNLFDVGFASSESYFSFGVQALAVANEDFPRFASTGEGVVLSELDETIDDSAKFFGSSQGCVDVAVANRLSRQVRQQGHSLVVGEAQFSSVNLVSHRVVSLSINP
jgi:hypothetical protein